jgi:hypothetical protein
MYLNYKLPTVACLVVRGAGVICTMGNIIIARIRDGEKRNKLQPLVG